MGQMSVSITKRAAFRDSTQEWSNVYTYGSIDAAGASAADNIIDEIVTFEKSIHASDVSFVRAKAWTSGGGEAANQMLVQKALTGAGTASKGALQGFDLERAYLLMWPAGKDSRGKTVYLRKWYHTNCVWPSLTFSYGVLANTNSLTTSERTTIQNKVDEITRVGISEAWGLVSKNGRERDGGAPICHKYLEHHQLGDMWRG